MTEISDHITSYRGDTPADHWDAIGTLVRTLATEYAGYRSLNVARRTIIALAGFFDWLYSTGAAPISRASLREDLVFGYELYRATEVSSRVAIQERNLLRAVAGLPKATPGNGVRSTTPTNPFPVYDVKALQQVREWASWQPNHLSGITAKGFAGLTLGCGLSASEVAQVHKDHVSAAGDAVIVDIPGTRARQVHADPEWRELLVAAAEVTPGYLVSPTGGLRTTVAVLDAVRNTHGASPTAGRARNTWLVARINEGHSPQALIRMSGLTNVRSLARIIRTHAPHRKDLLAVCDPA
ncbi:hypothetical protein [Microbacterium oleivorans]|uniref:hypothetical protein n=1 Tax=Microbacterium oleivorans TaxID=273677 RepID=UPI000767BC7F|nr:hypothetical protein [Microbacterium oleivorans]